MKKFTVIVMLSFAIIIMLFVSAFIYVDFNGRRTFLFDVYSSGERTGTVRVDRFITEEKVIYKSHAEYPGSLEYPITDEKMYLKRKTMTPQKFLEEVQGVKGRKRSTWLFRNGEETDFLFSEYPRIMFLKELKTGRKTMVFSPYSVMLCMPIVDKYNFWKKGTQFFEVMIPTGEPIPPMRDKIEMKYGQDNYISIGGRKIEAEVFILRSKGVPEVLLTLSKYLHEILEIEVKSAKIKMTLTKYPEATFSDIGILIDEAKGVLRKMMGKEASVKAYDGNTPKKTEKDDTSKEKETPVQIEVKDIFFESDNRILAGKIWSPSGEELSPGVIFVPTNTPVTRGEQALIDNTGRELAAAGFFVLSFDPPGQGRSQGNIADTDDELVLGNIKAAISYLEKYPGVSKGNISLIGYKGGGYLALKASQNDSSVISCMILGIPSGTDVPLKPEKKDLERILSGYGLGPFEQSFVTSVAKQVGKYKEEILVSEEKNVFFKGIRLPSGGYRDILMRRPYEAILAYEKPLLLIYGRDDQGFDVRVGEEIKKISKEKGDKVKIAEVRIAGKYMNGNTEGESSQKDAIDKDVLNLMTAWLRDKSVVPSLD